MRRESFVRDPRLIFAVQWHQTSVRNLVSLLRVEVIGPSLHKCGSVREEGPSGEKRTPDRSRPLELCSTEDHDHHLQNEAALM
jgi:hypothetical protein